MDSICGGTLGKIANGQAVDVILSRLCHRKIVKIIETCCECRQCTQITNFLTFEINVLTAYMYVYKSI